MAESVPASLILDAYKEIFRDARGGRPSEPLGWVLSVPDTHQKSVLAALDKERALRTLTCATEDEANAIAAGLCEPLLDTFSVPHARLEGPDDVHLIAKYFKLSRERRGPAAVLVGLETM